MKLHERPVVAEVHQDTAPSDWMVPEVVWSRTSWTPDSSEAAYELVPDSKETDI